MQADSDDELGRQIRLERMRQQKFDIDAADNQDTLMQDAIDYEDVKGRLSQWIQRAEVARWIRKIFAHFLRSYIDESGQNVYE
jgi:hypothetical protein